MCEILSQITRNKTSTSNFRLHQMGPAKQNQTSYTQPEWLNYQKQHTQMPRFSERNVSQTTSRQIFFTVYGCDMTSVKSSIKEKLRDIFCDSWMFVKRINIRRTERREKGLLLPLKVNS